MSSASPRHAAPRFRSAGCISGAPTRAGSAYRLRHRSGDAARPRRPRLGTAGRSGRCYSALIRRVTSAAVYKAHWLFTSCPAAGAVSDSTGELPSQPVEPRLIGNRILHGQLRLVGRGLRTIGFHSPVEGSESSNRPASLKASRISLSVSSRMSAFVYKRSATMRSASQNTMIRAAPRLPIPWSGRRSLKTGSPPTPGCR